MQSKNCRGYIARECPNAGKILRSSIWLWLEKAPTRVFHQKIWNPVWYVKAPSTRALQNFSLEVQVFARGTPPSVLFIYVSTRLFFIHHTRSSMSSYALYYIRRRLFLYVIKRAFTTSSHALHHHISQTTFLREHEAIFNSSRAIYLREHFFTIHTRTIFLRKAHALFFQVFTRIFLHSPNYARTSSIIILLYQSYALILRSSCRD